MRNLKTPQGCLKKGRAMFVPNVNHTGITTGTVIKMFGGLKDIKSDNIVFISETQILLKKGITFKFTVGLLMDYFSDLTGGNITAKLNFINSSNPSGVYGRTRLSSMPVSYSASGSFKPILIDEYTTSEDTVMELKCPSATGTGGTYTGGGDCYIYIEELEAYLIPTDPTKYIETINFTGVSGTGASGVVIASGLPVGTKKLIRKINNTQGIVEISCNGETFTPSALSNIRLNKNGDFFLIEKATSTRWDLVDGKETYDGAFSYIKRADGTAEETSDAYYCVNGNTTVPVQVITSNFSRFVIHVPSNNWAPQTLFHVYGTNVNISNAFAGNTFRIKSLGVWY